MPGTKSKPSPPPKLLIGWHLKILFDPNLKPFISPCVVRASIKYSEQDGKNLHLFPNNGEITY